MLLGFGPDKTVNPIVTTAYTVTVIDVNMCIATGMIMVTADNSCCDLMLLLDLTGDANFCENLRSSNNYGSNAKWYTIYYLDME